MDLAAIRNSVARAWLYLRGPSEVDLGRFSEAVRAAHAAGVIGDLVFRGLTRGFEPGSQQTSLALAMALVAVDLSRPMRAHPAASAASTFDYELRVSIPRSLYDRAKTARGRLYCYPVVEPISPPVRLTFLEFVRRFLVRADLIHESPSGVDRNRLSRAALAAHEAGLVGDVVLENLTREFDPRFRNALLALTTAIAVATLAPGMGVKSAAAAADTLGRELRASVPWRVYRRARREMRIRLSESGE
jgi:hypothetical protein